jgi:hypothetical protein
MIIYINGVFFGVLQIIFFRCDYSVTPDNQWNHAIIEIHFLLTYQWIIAII